MHKFVLAVMILLLAASSTPAQDFDTDVPMGWAVVPGYEIETTTGGAGGEVVTATSADQLASYASGSTPRIILVQGTLSGSTINVGNNKTIIGLGSNARLNGCQLNMKGNENIIIRNLTMSGATDGIATRGTHHVWIDHCDVSDCGDGLIDITKASDHHTVSWVRFSDHHKTMLINSGTSQPADIGTLNTTLHHNWWDGSDTRNPRAGYGKIHVFNCLYNNNDYGIGLHSQCRVLIERNYFINTNDCIHQMYRMDPNDEHHGFAEEVDNIFINTSGDMHDEGISFPVNEYYMYNFVLDPASDVQSIVQSGAGPDEEYGTIGLMPIPGQGAVDVASPTLSWKTGTQSANSYIVYFGTSLDPPQVDTTSGTSYNAGALSDGVVYYWRVDQVTSSGTIQGKLWAFRAKGTGTVYTLTTSVDGQGSISPSGGGYSAGSIVTLTAAGETGWKFDHWGGEVSGSDNPISITMDRDKTVTATFIQASTYNLTSSVTGQGTISPSNGTYNEGDVVSITPNPYAGWRFDGWGGDASGTDDPLLLTMDADKNITATFVEILEGYTYCSDEGETCTYTGTVDIAYGADGQFNYLYDQSSGSCDCNNDTFGDPIYGVRKACYVKPIGDVSVAGVTVSPTTASIGVGATTQLTATVSPSNATNKNVSWSSSDPAVATVDSSGLVAGVAEGSATITVTTEDGGFAATANVTVSSDQSTDYTYCSDEGETCTYTGTVDIAYGADGQFNYLYNQSSGSIGCNNSTFGDPIYGVRKACYVKPASTITDNVIVRARGTNGDEQISLVVDGVTIETWTLTTSYQDYSATASGTVQVHFLNDQGRTRDAQIDYVIIDNVTYQSEDQPTNTGVWQNHSCGGSYSEWLHCNGYIEY